MTIKELYDKLSNKDFQDYETGNLFFPAYMYMYNPLKEHEVENEILDIRNRLHRPNNYLEVMVIDIFEVFIEYIKNTKFGKENKLDFYLRHERQNKEQVHKALTKDAYDQRFLDFLNKKIEVHLESSKPYDVSYVLMKGFGYAFPYIRASRFMSNFEKYVDGYKLIMFYPGRAEEYYSLFGLLEDENLYRAIKLIN